MLGWRKKKKKRHGDGKWRKNGHLTTLIKHRLRHMYVNKVLSLAHFQFENVLDHGISRYFN